MNARTARSSAGSTDDIRSRPSPTATYLICYTPRSGSTLLCDALASTGLAGVPEEYFHIATEHISVKATLRDVSSWTNDWNILLPCEAFNSILRLGTTPNGVFGCKLDWDHVAFLREKLGQMGAPQGVSLAEQVAAALPNPRYIWLTRQDKVRQAVSLARAMQTSVYIKRSPGRSEARGARFNFRLIDWAMRDIMRMEKAWADYFAQSQITPFPVVYEDMVRNYDITLRNVLQFLQIDIPRDFISPPPHMYRQADELSEEWVQRYRRATNGSRWQRITTEIASLVQHRLFQSR